MRRLPQAYLDRLHNGDVEFKLRVFEQSAQASDMQPLGLAIQADNGQDVCSNEDYYPAECDPDHTRRILACLHYCHGMATSELEKQNALLGTSR